MEKLISLIDKRDYRKQAAQAELFRKEGNKHFGQKDSWGALDFYSRSILWAPTLSESLAIAYGNRSAVLFELSYFQECLRDIDRCLATKLFPDTSCHKLYSRRLKCLTKLGDQNSKLRGEIEELTEYLTKTEMDVSKKASVLKEAESLISKTNGLKIEAKENLPVVPQLLHGRNTRMFSLSEAVALGFSRTAGRHLLATSQIQPGSVLIVEKPYACVLLPHCYDRFCHHCLRQLPLDYVPCLECAQVRFCGEHCRFSAWTLYHWMECGALDFLSERGLAHLALRILLVTDINLIINHLACGHASEPVDREGVYGTGSDELFNSARSYDTVYNLVTHSKDMDPKDVEVYRATAQILVIYLQRRNYFSQLEAYLSGAPYICTNCKVAYVSEAVAKIVDAGEKLVQKAATTAVKNGESMAQNGVSTSTTGCAKPEKLDKSFGNDSGDDADPVLELSTVLKEYEPTILSSCLESLLLRHLQQLICNAHAVTCIMRFGGATQRETPQAGTNQNNSVSQTMPFEGARLPKLGHHLRKGLCSTIFGSNGPSSQLRSENQTPTFDGPTTTPNTLSFMESADQVRIASAIYPSAAMMNHSCDPNTFSSFVGNNLVVRAVKPIASDTEVLNLYGPHVGRMRTADRRAALSEQYFFQCNCPACSQKIPLSVNIKEAHEVAYKCQYCGGPVFRGSPEDCFADVELLKEAAFANSGSKNNTDKEHQGFCNSCRKTQTMPFKSALNVINALVSSQAIEGIEQARSMYENLFKLEELLYRHNRLLSEKRDYVAKRLAECGLFEGSATILMRNLDSIKFFYGSDTIEVANEYQKLIDVEAACLEQKLGAELSESINAAVVKSSSSVGNSNSNNNNSSRLEEVAKNLKEHVDAAIAIFSLYYGADCPQNLELTQLKQMVEFIRNPPPNGPAP